MVVKPHPSGLLNRFRAVPAQVLLFQSKHHAFDQALRPRAVWRDELLAQPVALGQPGVASKRKEYAIITPQEG